MIEKVRVLGRFSKYMKQVVEADLQIKINLEDYYG
jgi:hypothetical protein